MTREQFITHVESSQKAFRCFLVALCCGDTTLADDIAQEAYIKAYLTCEGLENAGKFNPWIFRIGYNTFIDYKRSARSFSDCSEVRGLQSGYSADSAFEYQALYQALEKLSAKERTSVLLFYMEGYSVKDIAAIIKSSESTVKKQLSRGREHLRGLLVKE